MADIIRTCQNAAQIAMETELAPGFIIWPLAPAVFDGPLLLTATGYILLLSLTG